MGQNSSCIQGNPDWLGPYMKAPGKCQEADFYDKIRKLAAAGSNSKDFYELENFFKSKVNPTCPQHGLGTLSSQTSKDITVPSKFEELFHKENHCKDVNFSHEQKDTKIPIVKPIIVNRSSCKVHGMRSEQEVLAVKRSTTCRLHGSSNVSEESIHSHQSKQMPPSYKNPPQPVISPAVHRQAMQYIYEKPIQIEVESSDDDMSVENTFSCPEFLLNLVLPTEEAQENDALAAIGVQSAKETIQKLEDRAESIVETFGVVLKHLEHGDWSTFCISTSRLCDDIRRVFRDYHLNSEKDIDATKIKSHVTSAMNQLTLNILSLSQTSTQDTNHHVLLPSFKVLGEALHEMMEFLIKKELKVLADCVLNSTNNLCIQMATCALAEMSLSGELMCKLIVQAGALLPLLNVCKTSKCRHLWPLVLRTLTVICSTKDAVEEFEKLSGFNIIMNIIEENSEKILSETVGLLAQLLKHWSEHNCSFQNKIGEYLQQLVKNLTVIAQKALSPEMFLLSAACLATLSSHSTEAMTWLHQHAQEMKLLATNTKQESYV